MPQDEKSKNVNKSDENKLNIPEELKTSAHWYVLHTYSGYENKVKASLEKLIENRGLEDQILEIIVPMEEQIEIKDGKRKASLKKVFPGYVLIKMFMNDDSWFVVRNIRGVTAFVGPGSKPVPLTEKEIMEMGIEELPVSLDFQVEDHVRIIDGPLEDFLGVVKEIDFDKKKVKVEIAMFKRDTLIELDFTQIQKL